MIAYNSALKAYFVRLQVLNYGKFLFICRSVILQAESRKDSEEV